MERRLSYIAGIKGVSAIFMVCYHYFTEMCNLDVSLIPISVTALFTQGWLLVELFFMISGFLMANAYAEKQLDKTFGQYISKRLFRIMPCFILANILLIILSIINGCYIHSDIVPPVNFWKVIISCMPFNYGWVSIADVPYCSIGWFISVLFLCYIIYFVILKI